MAMFAVSVTLCPTVDGLRDDESDSTGVDAAELTVCDDEAVPVANAASPSYRASIARPPALSPAVGSVAAPPEIAALPSSVVPSKKRTVPDGEPTAGAAAATVAANVIGIWKPDGSGDVLTDIATEPLAIVSAPLTKAIA